MKASLSSARYSAAALVAFWIAGCAAPNGGGFPGQGDRADLHHIVPDKYVVTFYDDPLNFSFPDGITTGPDGAFWFTAQTQTIGRVTTAGQYTMNANVGVDVSDGITVGSDNNLWFTAQQNSAAVIGRMTTGGALTIFNDPGGAAPREITTGPDGALWFAESNGTVGRMTTDGGSVRHFTLGPTGATLEGIVAGPDGNLWVTEPYRSSYGGSNKVYRLTPAGRVKQYTLGPRTGPYGICVGPDKALWFTEEDADVIGRLTTKGALSEFPTGETSTYPTGIAAGLDGAIWFANTLSPWGIGRVTTSGKVRLIRVRTKGTSPEVYRLTTGPDGNMWFTSNTDPPAVGKVTFVPQLSDRSSAPVVRDTVPPAP